MAGFPMARMVSPNGRWAYTLYAGGEETFIHALDTQGATAVCVDLDDVRVRDFYGLGLNLEAASGDADRAGSGDAEGDRRYANVLGQRAAVTRAAGRGQRIPANAAGSAGPRSAEGPPWSRCSAWRSGAAGPRPT